jgi:hypothetical protein
MATDVLANAKQFRDRTGKLTRAQELKWFGDTLGIDEFRMLRLIGYSPAVIKKRKAHGATFEDLAEAKPEGTVWVSELFRELADRSGYDMERLGDHIRRRGVRPKATANQHKASPQRTNTGLLRGIRAGGPGVFDAFASYLGSPPRPPRKRKKAS